MKPRTWRFLCGMVFNKKINFQNLAFLNFFIIDVLRHFFLILSLLIPFFHLLCVYFAHLYLDPSRGILSHCFYTVSHHMVSHHMAIKSHTFPTEYWFTYFYKCWCFSFIITINTLNFPLLFLLWSMVYL